MQMASTHTENKNIPHHDLLQRGQQARQQKGDDILVNLQAIQNSTTAATNAAVTTFALPLMFRPPVNRAMRVLDRSFFRKTIPLSAATVFDNSNIARVRVALTKSQDALNGPRLEVIRETPIGSLPVGNPHRDKEEAEDQLVVGVEEDGSLRMGTVSVGSNGGGSGNPATLTLTTPTPASSHAPNEGVGQGVVGKGKGNTKKPSLRKCLLLREGIKFNDATTWSPTICELVSKGTVGLGPYELVLDYDYWNYFDIISSILPEDVEEIPVGFTQTGHVLHLNLRERFLPYKSIIGEVLRDKNPVIRTVINKLEDVGSHSEFRTFPFEILAGDKDTNVVVHEQNCEFHFDFARVYWNSRLETEHRRLVSQLKEGEIVCDVMAGVGPFALPAGRKKVFVWANDLNHYGKEVMDDAIKRHKVGQFVSTFNMDGRAFIRQSAKDLLRLDPVKVKVPSPVRRHRRDQGQSNTPPPEPRYIVRPTTFDHYMMNLPATAIEFLDAFVGLYAGEESHFSPHTKKALPMIHVYCFSGSSDDERIDHEDICQRISERIGFKLTTDDMLVAGGRPELELSIHNVRLVSPKKQMFCASFRLPREVAFKSCDTTAFEGA